MKVLRGEAVLTTQFIDVGGFESFCRTAPANLRNAAGLALFRAAFEPLFVEGHLHADPHPGNQLYRSDGRIVLLDFGCVRAFDRPFVDRLRTFSRAVITGDRDAFRTSAIDLGLAPRPDRIDFDDLWRMYRWFYEPVRTPNFQFTREWWAVGRAFTKPSAKNARDQGFPPEWIWIQRVQWGLWAVLTRLQVPEVTCVPIPP